jgi:hypothetical protein
MEEFFRLDVYEKLNPRIPYLVGIDCSSGKGNDNNAITVINPYTVKPVAEFACQYIGESKFEKIIIELVRKHIPRGILIIERNNVGDAIIDHLMESEVAYNLYYDKNKDLLQNKISGYSTVESMLKAKASEKSYYGVWTGVNSRSDMFSILANHMHDYKDNFVTKNIIEDISRLVRTKTGKIEAGPGFHDDSIMSYLVAMYVFYHGNNLASFGFIKGQKLDETTKRPEMTIDDLDPGVLPEWEVQKLKQQQEFKEANDYATIYRNAVAAAQKDTRNLVERNMTEDETMSHTAASLVDSYSYDTTTDLELFDELNNW